MSHDLTTTELDTVSTLIRGGERAMVNFFESQRDELKRFIRLRLDPRLLRRIDESDVIQEAFFESTKRIVNYLKEPRIPPTAWLRRVVRQVVARIKRDHLQMQCRDVRREAYQATFARIDVEEFTDSITSPLTAIQRAEVHRKVSDIIESMSPVEREILVLVHFEERSVREAAAELDISLEAAKKRYRRALERLKKMSDLTSSVCQP